MNAIITLPKELWQKIQTREKIYECRKIVPHKLLPGSSRVYVVLKGTSDVVGYFTFGGSRMFCLLDWNDRQIIPFIGVPMSWLQKYLSKGYCGFIWNIQSVCSFQVPKNRFNDFGLTTNPQSFIYTSLSIKD